MVLTVGRKLVLTYILILVIMGVMGFMDLKNMRGLQENTREITRNWLIGTEVANQVKYAKEHILTLYYQQLLEPNPAKKEEINKQTEATFQQIDDQLVKYETALADEQDAANFALLKKRWDLFKETNNRQKAAGKGGGEASAELSKAFADVQESIDIIVEYNHRARQSELDSNELYRVSMIELIVLLAVAFVSVIVISYLVNRYISKPVVQASEALQRISQGDLTGRTIAYKFHDEIGTMISSVNRVSASLRDSVLRMQEASNLVAASAQELSASSEQNAAASEHVTTSIQDVASGSENQAQSALECGRAMDEMAIGIQRIAEATSDISELSAEASSRAEKGAEVIQQASVKIHSISSAVGKAGGVIRELDEHSHNINRISLFIGEIAAQTNLLSLNAAIEAARAGEHGRGFAVVAGEIQKLSAQTANSIQEINEVIEGIRSSTVQAVRSMDEGLTEVQEGLQAVARAEETFGMIVDSTVEVSKRVQEAAAAAEEMSASSEEVAATVTTMGVIAEQTSSLAQTVAATTEQQLASIQEITSSANALSGISEDLHRLVVQYKVT
ncbi:methyl-accepting chemotaxis protein [Paenibacillus sp. NPDC056579]|uniref:methyl-accepting chemotaxis protein n=1 Tax=Paenibacillus sp. NPDC056579 TaxID=3345871 RepID=UPI0036842D06